MSTINIFDMKCELAIAMRDVVEARHQFKKAQAILSEHGISEGRSFMSGLRSHFEDVLKHYFEEKSRELTRLHADGTPAEVSLDSRFYSFERMPSFMYHDSHLRENSDDRYIRQEAWHKLQDAETQEAEASAQVRVMCEALDSLNWEGIKNDLESQANSLASEGRRLVAETVVNQLSMKHRFHEPKFKSGRFIFSTYSTSWMQNHDKMREVHKLIDALNKITQETGFVFGHALHALNHEIQNLGYDKEQIASRTILCKGDPIEVRCFKEKYEYRFTQDAFEAIQAFISLYGGDAEIDAVMNTAQLAQPKAA